MLTAMYKSSHFYMQSLLYVTVCFTRFFIGFVDGAYIPNYGFVGCYLYTNHMEQFTGFNQASNVLGPTTVHSCVQSCMQRDWEYAGLMAGSRCFCGRSYNQTFAVDQRHCSIKCRYKGMHLSPYVGAKHMAVYNTDYDVKPLLSIPGNNTNFLEVWNKALVGQLDGFADVFLDDVLRNSDIDWWNKTKLYHTPEYVSVMLFNRYGHPLWSIDFFTNDTNSANVEDWLRKDRILPNKYFTNSMKNNAAISISDEKITIRHKQENKVWFAHGNLNNREARVTVFDPQRNTVGQSETHTEVTYLKCSEYHNSEKCKMNLSRSGACDCENKVDGACLEYKVKRSDQQQEFKPTCTSESVKDVCYTDGNKAWSCNSTSNQNNEYRLFTIGPNYGLQRMEQVKAHRIDCKDEHEENKPFYICGIEVSDYIGTLELEFWPNEEVNESKSVTIDLSRNPKPLSCIYTQRMKLKFPNPQQQCTFHLYKPKNDSLIMADRVAVLGFYHREEPKVSKWEFLNNYSIDEIKNIMRPVLQKARAATQVQVRNLSSSIRKKESATDFRTSSQGIGILGGFLLGMVFLVIFVSDIFVLRAHLKMMFRNVSSCFKHSKKVN